MPRSQGQAVVILGASRGLGRAIAIAAAEAGFSVVLGCRKQSDGDAIATDLTARGLMARALEVDVTEYAEVEAALSQARDWRGGLYGVVNNAGVIAPIGRIEDTSPSDWLAGIQINLVGAYHGTRAALRHLVPQGVIINLSSGAAHRPIEGWSAYCAAKAGLAMLTRSTFLEHQDRVRVYGAQPGMVDTDMHGEIRASRIGPVSRVARESLTDAALPAAALVWLLQEAPKDLSGQEVDLEAQAIRKRIDLAQKQPN